MSELTDDRAMLEAAARAVNGGGWHPLTHDTPNGKWNPLEDDGDALRLAVKLGIHISQQLSYCATLCPHGNNSARGTTWTEQYNADPAKATRRAIVRAAAALAPPTA
jgi:hypothetical protein